MQLHTLFILGLLSAGEVMAYTKEFKKDIFDKLATEGNRRWASANAHAQSSVNVANLVSQGTWGLAHTPSRSMKRPKAYGDVQVTPRWQNVLQQKSGGNGKFDITFSPATGALVYLDIHNGNVDIVDEAIKQGKASKSDQACLVFLKSSRAKVAGSDAPVRDPNAISSADAGWFLYKEQAESLKVDPKGIKHVIHNNAVAHCATDLLGAIWEEYTTEPKAKRSTNSSKSPGSCKVQPSSTKTGAPTKTSSVATKKPSSTKKPSTKKPSTKKPSTKKPSTKNPSTKSPSTKDPSAKKTTTTPKPKACKGKKCKRGTSPGPADGSKPKKPASPAQGSETQGEACGSANYVNSHGTAKVRNGKPLHKGTAPMSFTPSDPEFAAIMGLDNGASVRDLLKFYSGETGKTGVSKVNIVLGDGEYHIWWDLK